VVLRTVRCASAFRRCDSSESCRAVRSSRASARVGLMNGAFEWPRDRFGGIKGDSTLVLSGNERHRFGGGSRFRAVRVCRLLNYGWIGIPWGPVKVVGGSGPLLVGGMGLGVVRSFRRSDGATKNDRNGKRGRVCSDASAAIDEGNSSKGVALWGGFPAGCWWLRSSSGRRKAKT